MDVLPQTKIEKRFNCTLSRQVSDLNKENIIKLSLSESLDARQKNKFTGDGIKMDKQIVEDYFRSIGHKKDKDQ